GHHGLGDDESHCERNVADDDVRDDLESRVEDEAGDGAADAEYDGADKSGVTVCGQRDLEFFGTRSADHVGLDAVIGIANRLAAALAGVLVARSVLGRLELGRIHERHLAKGGAEDSTGFNSKQLILSNGSKRRANLVEVIDRHDRTPRSSALHSRVW